MEHHVSNTLFKRGIICFFIAEELCVSISVSNCQIQENVVSQQNINKICPTNRSVLIAPWWIFYIEIKDVGNVKEQFCFLFLNKLTCSLLKKKIKSVMHF